MDMREARLPATREASRGVAKQVRSVDAVPSALSILKGSS